MISVIVPTYRRNEELRLCLESLRRNTRSKGCEILVPHPLPDERLEEICREFSALPYIDDSRKDGRRIRSLWGIINEGMEKASFRYATWLNDDCTVLPDWDSHALGCFQGKVALVILQASGINAQREFAYIEAGLGLPCANYGVLDLERGVRFDERFSWLYGDADISLQVALENNLQIAVTTEPCVIHHHFLDENRIANLKDERLKSDERLFRHKWRTWARVGGRALDLRWKPLARGARKFLPQQQASSIDDLIFSR
jgi:hypothetical protein